MMPAALGSLGKLKSDVVAAIIENTWTDIKR